MSLPALIQGLLDPAAYPDAVTEVRLIETHISWVLIAGEHAYKIKKPVDLGFLDFSSLEKRRFCCEEEIRLNRRLAPDTYLETVPVTGTPTSPKIGGAGEALEWAVKMRAFPADATLDRETEITPAQIDAIAERVARFHGEVASVPADSAFGGPEEVMRPVRENFRQIRSLQPPAGCLALLNRLETWSEAEAGRLHGHFSRRKAAGHIRECHGDLHLGNIAWVGRQPLIFDCIEFSPALRYIDPISEVAFLAMDLIHRNREDLAWRFLDRWLADSGDFDGLAAYRFYLVYRAMVRAKVACIRGSQDNLTPGHEAQAYLELAQQLSQVLPPYLLLMHGFSGCGKTWLSQRLLESLGAVRLRSDVERKRLAGIAAMDASASPLAGGLYSPDATRLTFRHLRERTARLLDEGFPVIVDATFLSRDLRQSFLDLAQARGLPVRIISVQAPVALLRARILHRQGRDASEADLAVLEAQILQHDPLSDRERELSVLMNMAEDASWPDTVAGWRELFRLPAPEFAKNIPD